MEQENLKNEREQTMFKVDKPTITRYDYWRGNYGYKIEIPYFWMVQEKHYRLKLLNWFIRLLYYEIKPQRNDE